MITIFENYKKCKFQVGDTVYSITKSPFIVKGRKYEIAEITYDSHRDTYYAKLLDCVKQKYIGWEYLDNYLTDNIEKAKWNDLENFESEFEIDVKKYNL
jgi:hypothetical protein